MATIVSWNGTNFTVPATGEENWGGVSKVDGLLISLAQNGLQKTGGLFTLSADVDWGGSAGHLVSYIKSRTTPLATAGTLRMARTDSIGWRNQADSADVLLGVNSSNQLTFNGATFLTTVGALTASRVVVTDGSGSLITSSVTTTTLAFLDATSSIQTQLNTKITASSSDTLTNKLFTDSSCSFADNGDTTKRLAFQCAGITTGTTRTATPPNEDFTIVGVDSDQLLTKKRIAVASKTSAYTATVSDQFIDCSASGAAFTITLPTAVGITGKMFTFRKSDSTFNAVTIDGNASETIDSALTTTLNTQYERLTIVSDGANWLIAARSIPSIYTTYTPTLSNFGNGTSSLRLLRVGQLAYIKGILTVGATLPTGDFGFTSPTGIAPDTTVMPVAPTPAIPLGYPTGGLGFYQDTSTNVLPLNGSAMVIWDSAGSRFRFYGMGNYWNVSFPASAAAGDIVEIDIHFPVVGWNG